MLQRIHDSKLLINTHRSLVNYVLIAKSNTLQVLILSVRSK